MATTTLSPQEAMAQALIDELAVIAEQNEAGKEQTAEVRASRRSLVAMSNKLDDLTQLLVDKEIDPDAVETVSNLLAQWADVIAPDAAVLWDRETATAKIQILNGFGQLGFLTEAQQATLDEIKAKLTIRRMGDGTRTPQEAIEGRPEWVSIANAQGEIISTQKGNVQTSVGNLRARVESYLKQNDVVLSDEQNIEVREAARKVVVGEESTASAEGFTFAVATKN